MTANGGSARRDQPYGAVHSTPPFASDPVSLGLLTLDFACVALAPELHTCLVADPPWYRPSRS
jgi:hypothetical protein